MGDGRDGRAWLWYRATLLLLSWWAQVAHAGLAMVQTEVPLALTAAVEAGQRLRVNAVSVLSGVQAGHGWAVGDRDTVLLTSDLGESWSTSSTGLGDTQDWYGVHFSTVDLGWIVGGGGKVRWVTLRARWVTLRARWVPLRARWVTLRARWVTRGDGRHESSGVGCSPAVTANTHHEEVSTSRVPHP